jgi:hypothetical protein
MLRSEYNELINRGDEVAMHAIGRALVHLFRRQTEDEQQSNDTRHDNRRGFTAGDARKGSITAKYYIKHRRLLDWQIELWLKRDSRGRQRIGKYYRQIAEEAAKKSAQRG